MNQSTPPPAAVGRLPVLTIARHANAITLGQPGLLARAAVVPFLLSMLVAALTLATPAFPMISLALAVAGLAPYAMFGVAWCRVILLGPVAGQPRRALSWERRHWRYFGYLAALAFIAFGLLIPPLIVVAFQAIMMAGTAGSGSVLAMFLLGELAVIVGVAYLAARVSFVFPAAAVDEAYSWRHSWAHTRRQGMRLLASIVLSMAPVVVVLWVIARLLGIFAFPEMEAAVVQDGAGAEDAIKQYLADNAGRLITAQIAMTAMSYLVMGVVMAAIALAFRIGTGWVPAAATPPAEA